MVLNLSGQVALVTGGATGIGLVMAEALGKAGAKVWLASRNAIAIATAEHGLTESGIAAQGSRLDVSQSSEVETLVRDILRHDGRIDILLNSMGVMINRPVVEMPEEVWDRVIGVSLKRTFLCTQAAARGLIARGYRRIIHFSSGHVTGNPTNSAYSASKAGAEAFTRTFAAELKEHNVDVTINAVNPGGTDTPMWRRGKSAVINGQVIERGTLPPLDSELLDFSR